MDFGRAKILSILSKRGEQGEGETPSRHPARRPRYRLLADHQFTGDGFGGHGELDPEDGTGAEGAFDVDPAVMLLDDPLGNGESEAGATQVAAACFVHAVEPLEDAGLILFGDPQAVVAHADQRFSFALLGGERYGASGRVRVLEGVIEKNVDDAAQGLGIAKNAEFGA